MEGGSGGVMGRERGREELGRGEELRRGEGEVRERGGSEVCSWFMGAHRLWARIGRGRA